MEFELILFKEENSVGCISLNRPEVLNSLNGRMARELQGALDYCKNDKEIRSIYLTGIGKAFCAGQDLKEAIDPEGPGIRRIVAEHYNPVILRIREIEKPVICAVNGVAAGAGANIALSCDVVFAGKSASFIQAFSKIGLIPDSGGTYILPRLIGWQRASAIMMLGDKVSAEQAWQMGMIYKVCPDEILQDESLSVARFLAGMPTKGLGLTKRALNKSFSNSLESQLLLEGELQGEAGNTGDYREGVQAFMEKRKPVFKGE